VIKPLLKRVYQALNLGLVEEHPVVDFIEAKPECLCAVRQGIAALHRALDTVVVRESNDRLAPLVQLGLAKSALDAEDEVFWRLRHLSLPSWTLSWSSSSTTMSSAIFTTVAPLQARWCKALAQ